MSRFLAGVPMFSKNLKHQYCKPFSDGSMIGDGSDEVDPNDSTVKRGMCQQEDSTRKCLSTGECRACKFVTTSKTWTLSGVQWTSADGPAVNKYEGCDIKTGTPICNADMTSTTVKFATDDYDSDSVVPNCVPCKKLGMYTRLSLD